LAPPAAMKKPLTHEGLPRGPDSVSAAWSEAGHGR
jgi:hypothetical protein